MRMRAISALRREVGISAVSWSALLAFRIRVSMSAMGSVSIVSLLPGRLGHARNRALVRQFAQADPAQAELAIDGARPAAAVAASVLAGRKAWLALRLRDQGLLSQRLAPLFAPRRTGSRGRAGAPSPRR